MEAEMEVSSRLVELSDMDVVRDINYQDLLIEHVKHQENGLVIKLYVKVKLYRNMTFMTGIESIDLMLEEWVLFMFE